MKFPAADVIPELPHEGFGTRNRLPWLKFAARDRRASPRGQSPQPLTCVQPGQLGVSTTSGAYDIGFLPGNPRMLASNGPVCIGPDGPIMNILLTNDDGVDAPGLRAAHAALRGLGEIHVVAPNRERSACGHAITLRGKVRVERIDHAAFGTAFSVDGLPADCVRLAVAHLVKEPIDLVVSGINEGANAGVDTYYSGTIAAAREGALMGLRSIAFSQALHRGVAVDWSAAERCTTVLARQLIGESLPGAGFWSVNFPAPIPQGSEHRVHRVPVAHAPIPLDFEHVQHDGDRIYEFGYERSYWSREVNGASDYTTIRDGNIAVTAIPLFGKF